MNIGEEKHEFLKYLILAHLIVLCFTDVFNKLKAIPFPSKIAPRFILIPALLQWLELNARSLRDVCIRIGMGGRTWSICRWTCVTWELKLSCGKSGSPTVQTGWRGLRQPSAARGAPWAGIFQLYYGPKSLLPRSWRWMVGLMIQALQTLLQIAELPLLFCVWARQQWTG